MSVSAPAPTHNGSLEGDSAIAKSWDRVVSDYKTFHAVRARGGTARDLPVFPDTSNTETESTQDAKADTEVGAAQDDAAHNGSSMTSEADDPNGMTGANSGDSPTDDNSNPGPALAPETTEQVLPVPVLPPVPGIVPPQAVLGGADDAMKKLLMSWYYAGYYTGLYEGEQKALQQQKQQQQQPEGATNKGDQDKSRGDDEAQK